MTSYFSFAGQFNKQVDGVAMGSPLSPVIASLYMEDFEGMVLNTHTHKPLNWFRYMANIFFSWPYGPDRLKERVLLI
jgi:hypothetical protein